VTAPVSTTADAGVPACAEVRAGRPRRAEVDEAILDAAIDLFAEHGWAGLTIEAVAERAGVAKSTVYRRYSEKADLVVASMQRCHESTPALPDTGDLRADLLGATAILCEVFQSSDAGRVIPASIVAAAGDPTFAAIRLEHVGRRRKAMVELVERAVARGDLAPGVDVDLLVDMITGTVFYRVFHKPGPLDDDALADIVDVAMAGVAAITPMSALGR
jgi:AcrR family transcriptional regulator